LVKVGDTDKPEKGDAPGSPEICKRGGHDKLGTKWVKLNWVWVDGTTGWAMPLVEAAKGGEKDWCREPLRTKKKDWVKGDRPNKGECKIQKKGGRRKGVPLVKQESPDRG